MYAKFGCFQIKLTGFVDVVFVKCWNSCFVPAFDERFQYLTESFFNISSSIEKLKFKPKACDLFGFKNRSKSKNN